MGVYPAFPNIFFSFFTWMHFANISWRSAVNGSWWMKPKQCFPMNCKHQRICAVFVSSCLLRKLNTAWRNSKPIYTRTHGAFRTVFTFLFLGVYIRCVSRVSTDTICSRSKLTSAKSGSDSLHNAHSSHSALVFFFEDAQRGISRKSEREVERSPPNNSSLYIHFGLVWLQA